MDVQASAHVFRAIAIKQVLSRCQPLDVGAIVVVEVDIEGESSFLAYSRCDVTAGDCVAIEECR